MVSRKDEQVEGFRVWDLGFRLSYIMEHTMVSRRDEEVEGFRI